MVANKGAKKTQAVPVKNSFNTNNSKYLSPIASIQDKLFLDADIVISVFNVRGLGVHCFLLFIK